MVADMYKHAQISKCMYVWTSVYVCMNKVVCVCVCAVLFVCRLSLGDSGSADHPFKVMADQLAEQGPHT